MQRLRRLLSMPPREVSYRAAELLWGWRERLAAGLAGAGRHSWDDSITVPPSSFFLLDGGECEPVRDGVAALRRDFEERFPEERADLVQRADRACAGIFRLFGRDVDVSAGPVDWHRDWVTDAAYPRRFYRDIPVFDPRRIPDRKRVWELNRQQFLVTLGQAFLLTRDETYARRAIELIESWIDGNPRYTGFNWKEALEVALRLLSWTFTLRLLRGFEIAPASKATILGAIETQYTFIGRHLSLFSSPNTHIIGEALALYVVGHEFPQIRAARRMRGHALAMLDDALGEQFGEDGSHFEKSAYYHAYAVEMYLLAAIYARQRGHGLADSWRPALSRMAGFLAAITRPDGSLARFGDDDGGKTVRVGADDHYDARPLLAVAASFLESPELKAVAGSASPDAWWLLGPAGVRAFEALPRRESAPGGRAFSDGGVAVLREGRGPNASCVVAQSSPFGAMTAGHSHGGLLSFEASLDGELLFADPGTFSYGEGSAWRDAMRAFGAHNTVRIDGREPWSMADTFRWEPAETLEIQLDASAAGITVGYRASAQGRDPIGHRREIRCGADAPLSIVDHFEGHGRHLLSYRLQLAPGWRLEPAGRQRWALTRGEARLELSLDGFGETATEIREGSIDPIAGWYSERFDAKQPAPLLEIEEAGASFPARRVLRVVRRDDASRAGRAR